MKKAIFMSMLACVAGFLFAGCGKEKEDEPQVKDDQTKVTVKYNFEQSKELHDAVDVEIEYYDLGSGEIVKEVMPASINGKETIAIEGNESVTCGFNLTFKAKEGFVAVAESTYDWSLNYSVDVIVEQPGKDAQMWTDEGAPLFSFPAVNAESVSDMINLLNEGEYRVGCDVKNVDGTFYIYDKQNNE